MLPNLCGQALSITPETEVAPHLLIQAGLTRYRTINDSVVPYWMAIVNSKLIAFLVHHKDEGVLAQIISNLTYTTLLPLTMPPKSIDPKFQLGMLFATPNALDQVPNDDIQTSLSRHLSGDWGDVCKDDWKANDQALLDDTRLLSVYNSTSGVKFWIITEADRSLTTVLMPEDY